MGSDSFLCQKIQDHIQGNSVVIFQFINWMPKALHYTVYCITVYNLTNQNLKILIYLLYVKTLRKSINLYSSKVKQVMISDISCWLLVSLKNNGQS